MTDPVSEFRLDGEVAVVTGDASGIGRAVAAAFGSGRGDPRERPVDGVQRDLDTGYITAAGAERDYGCVVRDGRVSR